MFYVLVVISIAIIYTAIRADRRAERRRRTREFEQFNSRTGIHPADDIYEGDSWPSLEAYLDRQPELRRRYEREALSHRGKGGV